MVVETQDSAVTQSCIAVLLEALQVKAALMLSTLAALLVGHPIPSVSLPEDRSVWSASDMSNESQRNLLWLLSFLTTNLKANKALI